MGDPLKIGERPGNDEAIRDTLAQVRRSTALAEESAAAAVPNYETCKRCQRAGRNDLQPTYMVKLREELRRFELRGKMRRIRINFCRQWCLRCDGRPPLDRVISDPQAS